MQRIKFQKRAVAFIDVLGFKPIVEGVSKNKNNNNRSVLEELITTLNDSIPNLNDSVEKYIPKNLIPRHISISDSIILSAPLKSRSKYIKNYCGLSVLVMRVIQLTHIMLNEGYLLRGGISIGDVWHTDRNIVGPAYQEAYFIESNTGAPRVELSAKAEKYWIRKYSDTNSMCLKYKDKFMVNGLHDCYIMNNDIGVRGVFESYKNIIDKKIQENINYDVQFKWWWFSKFLENEVCRNKFIDLI